MNISVVIPAYNTEAYIDRTLRNIAEEQFGKSPADLWEIIVVNDGSTDSTSAIVEQWVRKYPSNIRLVNQPNAGVSASRNRGIDLARGEYIYFMDSDDLLRQGALPDLLAAASASNVDMLAFYYDEITSDEYKEYSVSSPEHIPLPTAAPTTAHEYLTMTDGMVWINMIGAVWRAIYKKTFITGIQLRFDPRLSFGEDSIFNLEILFANPRMAIMPQKLYFYNNRRGNNATRNTDKTHLRRITDSMEIYLSELTRLKRIAINNDDITDSILWLLNESSNYAYQLISANSIMLGDSFSKLLRLRRAYRDAGGKTSPGRPRFTEKDRKYTLSQHLRRWIFAYPVMIAAGLWDWLCGNGLWLSRTGIELRRLLSESYAQTAEKKTVITESIHHDGNRIAVIAGEYISGSTEAKVLDITSEKSGIINPQILVLSPHIPINTIESIINKGYYPLEFREINGYTIANENNLTRMMEYLTATQNIDEVWIMPSASAIRIPTVHGIPVIKHISVPKELCT